MNEQMPTQSPHAVQGTLSENAAGGLAYVFLIPAVFFLLTEPYNKNSYIRFHSWQCVFMAIAWVVIDTAIWIFTHAMSFLSLIASGLYPLIALAMIILWIMVLIKAFNGERFRLPIVGDLAEKQAGR